MLETQLFPCNTRKERSRNLFGFSSQVIHQGQETTKVTPERSSTPPPPKNSYLVCLSFTKRFLQSAAVNFFFVMSSTSVGNPMNHNNGKPFSTYDRDSDDAIAYNCAEKHRGAWWFGYYNHSYENRYHFCWKWRINNTSEYCGDSNLNGDQHENGIRSIFLWYTNDNSEWHQCGITRTEMKIRPV